MKRALLSGLAVMALCAVFGSGCSSSGEDGEAVGTSSDAVVGGAAESRFAAVGYIDVRKKALATWGQLNCTGTMISPNVMLTAAHCFDPLEDASYDYSVARVGFGAFGGPVIPTSRILIHPGYVNRFKAEGDLDNDIALLVLAQNAPVPPVRHLGHTWVGHRLLAVGYGADNDVVTTYNPSRRSFDAIVDLVDQDHWGSNGDEIWGHGISNSGGICRGDSGGPLLSADGATIYGVTSRGSCARGGRNIWTSVEHVQAWIEARVSENTPALPPPVYGDTTPPCINNVLGPHDNSIATGISGSSVIVRDPNSPNVRVNFYINGVLVGYDDTPTADILGPRYSVPYDTRAFPDGAATATWNAVDPAGNASASLPYCSVTSHFSIDNSSPAVTITSPAAGAALSGMIHVKAKVTDSNFKGINFTANGKVMTIGVANYPYFEAFWNSAEVAGGPVTIEARGFDHTGLTATKTVIVNVDNTDPRPATPLALAGGAVAYNQIWLDWAESADPSVTAYRVYRGTPTDQGLIATVNGRTTSGYADVNLTENSYYSYYVQAVAADGTRSFFSKMLSTFTPIGPAKSIPLYQYWSNPLGDQYLVTARSDAGLATLSFYYGGTLGRVFAPSVPANGTVAVYQYWNGAIGDHLYTNDYGELGGGKNGWASEGQVFRVLDKNYAGSVPLYRYWDTSTTDHWYSKSYYPNGVKSSNYEGILGYVYP
jgi:Trypsin/Bacterial Ig domain